MPKISKEEARAIRRETINRFLHEWPHWQDYKTTREWIRLSERACYGKEMNVYKYYKV